MDATQREFFEKTQDNKKESFAIRGMHVEEALAVTCGICGGVDGLNLQDGTVAATCFYCYEASRTGTPARRIVNPSAKEKARPATPRMKFIESTEKTMNIPKLKNMLAIYSFIKAMDAMDAYFRLPTATPIIMNSTDKLKEMLAIYSFIKTMDAMDASCRAMDAMQRSV